MVLKKIDFSRVVTILFILIASGIAACVLFRFPMPGVADQGDFDRVIFPSGLGLKPEYQNAGFNRFFDYITTDFLINDISVTKLLLMNVSGVTYLIAAINLFCAALGQNIFKTEYLAALYIIIYISSFYIILKYFNFKSKLQLLLITVSALFILMDGNYLVWFNSLYGEPMMIVSLTLMTAAWVYYIYCRHNLKSETKLFSKLIFVYLSSLLFLISKMQLITALPIIFAMLLKALIDNRYLLNKYHKLILASLLCIVIIYPVRLNLINTGISNDTHYNSVFFGVLKDSPNPAEDLIDMGLNPDLAVEAGKNTYMDASHYIRYIPRTEITQKEFYSKITNAKLIYFYMTHPMKFINGMEYTASHAFSTSTSLGKFSQAISITPVREFNRFVLWSSIREKYLPKNLLFIAAFFLSLLCTSIFIYKRNKTDLLVRSKFQLLWGIMAVAVLQFPMPYLGNGQADTSKQLFLFNFIFDVLLVLSICWCLNSFICFIHKKTKIIISPR